MGGGMESWASRPSGRFIAAPEGMDSLLWERVIEQRLASPDLNTKQVHAKLQAAEPQRWAELSHSEVRRVCSKLAKKAKENGGSVQLKPTNTPAESPKPAKPAALTEVTVTVPGIGTNHSLVHDDR